MSPTLSKLVPFLDFPVDFNKRYRKKPVLGKNKTFRGIFFGTLMAIVIVNIQRLLYPLMADYSILDYSTINPSLLGFLFGFGAMLGDLVKSFFKRQRGIKPGKSWIPFDQIDWVLGALLLVLLYIQIPLKIIVASVILFGLLHPITNYIGYLLRAQKNRI